MKVSCINYDGTVYLVPDDEHYCDPDETEIENVDALPIDADLLRGFGFEVIPKDYPKDEFNVLYCGKKICELWECGNCISIETQWNSYEYFHEFMGYIYYILPKTFKLEWKGIEK